MRLGKHEHDEGISRKGALLVKDSAAQIVLQAQLPLLIRAEREVVPLIHLRKVDPKLFRGTLSGCAVPAVAKQYSSKIQKKGGDCATLVSHVSTSSCLCVSLVRLISLVLLV